MGAVGLVLWSELRNRWRAWSALALLVALVSAAVLAATAAGRRTDGAYPEFVAAHGYDALVYNNQPIPLATISELPEVLSATAVESPANGQPACATCKASFGEAVNSNNFSFFEAPRQALPRLIKLLSGKMPDPAAPDQVLASFDLQQQGVQVGSVVRVPLFSVSQISALESSAGSVVPQGPTVDLHVVGIEAAQLEFATTGGGAYDLWATPAFSGKYNARTAVFTSEFVRLRHGAADLPKLNVDAQRFATSFLDEVGAANATAGSIHPQAIGWWVLGALAALAGLVTLAQGVSRQWRTEGENFRRLRALGLRPKDFYLIGIGRALAIATSGALAGIGLAFALSPLAPVGEARVAEVSNGFNFDAPVLSLGGFATLVALVGISLWPTTRESMPRHDEKALIERPSVVASWFAKTGAPPGAVIGVRNALERGRGQRSVPVTSALLGTVLAVMALCGTAVFGASLTHLTRTPTLYGQVFQAWFSGFGFPGGPLGLPFVGKMERDPSISAITVGTSGEVTINGLSVNAIAGTPLRGDLLLAKVGGRLPKRAGEVALGSTTMRHVHAHIGSSVLVRVPLESGGTRTSVFTVVGTTSFPADFGKGSLGTGAIFTIPGFAAAQCPAGPDAAACQQTLEKSLPQVLLVSGIPGPAGKAAITRYVHEYPNVANLPTVPTNLVNFGEAVDFPLIFGVVLGMFGAATLLHVLLVSVNKRRSEVGLLKALGLLRSQVASCVCWQATTVAAIGILVGVPTGVAIGRVVWHAFASNLGVVPNSIVVIWVIAALAFGVLVLANLLAIGPALTAARTRTAFLLRTE